MREEATASNTLVSLIETITQCPRRGQRCARWFRDPTGADRLLAAGGRAVCRERFRVINERLYDVAGDFPRLSPASFVDGLPDGVERIEYEVDLDVCADLIIASAPSEFEPPSTSA